MGSYIDHANREFQAAGWLDADGNFKDDMQKLMCEQVMALLALFSEHGHGGSSAPYAIGLFKNLAAFEPIVPLTGEDSEWNEVGEGVFQNNRCSHVFKQSDRFNGQAYDINGIVFKDSDGCYFTNSESFVPIIFPYTPRIEYREKWPKEGKE